MNRDDMIAAITTAIAALSDTDFLTFIRGAIGRQLPTMGDAQLTVIATNLGINTGG